MELNASDHRHTNEAGQGFDHLSPSGDASADPLEG